MRKIDDWHEIDSMWYDLRTSPRGGTIVADMATGAVHWEDNEHLGRNRYDRTESTVEVMSLSAEGCKYFLEPGLVARSRLRRGRAGGEEGAGTARLKETVRRLIR